MPRPATHPELDPTTIERAQRGDKQAVTIVLEHHYEQIHRMLVHLVGRSPDLDDLRQQVLLAVVSGLPRFRRESELSTWIGGICVNVAKTHFRAKRTRSERTVDDGHGAIDETAGGDARAEVEHRADLASVEAALATLSIEQRACFVLSEVYGHSVKEIAKLTDAAWSTTRLRLYYGRKKFFAALGKADKS